MSDLKEKEMDTLTEVRQEDVIEDEMVPVSEPAKADDAEGVKEETLEAFELDDLSAPKEWRFEMPVEGQRVERVYVQRQLGIVAKLEFFSHVTGTVEEILKGSGDGNVSMEGLQELLGANDMAGMADTVKDVAGVLEVVLRVSQHAPDFLLKCWTIWLQVPPAERPWAEAAMSQPEDEGGLSDDEGFEMIEIFFDQNGRAMRDFFVLRLAQAATRAQARIGTQSTGDSPAPPSKRSIRSPRRSASSRTR